MRGYLLALAALAVSQAALAGSTVAPATSAQRAQALTITASDIGSTVTLKRHQCLILNLSTQAASTGYDWYLADDSTALLQQKSRLVTTTSEMPGAPAALEYVFCPLKAGRGLLHLEYKRIWEKKLAPAQTLRYVVQIAR